MDQILAFVVVFVSSWVAYFGLPERTAQRCNNPLDVCRDHDWHMWWNPDARLFAEPGVRTLQIPRN